jgi:hypothetical protein
LIQQVKQTPKQKTKVKEMTNLLDTVQYITIQDLQTGFADGTWRFCRKEFYIRQSVDTKSVAEKKEALLTDIKNEGQSQVGVVKVLEALAVNQFEEDGKVINEVISGNTRIRALLEMFATKPPAVTIGSNPKESMVVIVKSFEPIPYRLFESPISINDAIEFQTSTNDFTKRHNPLDIALKVVELKPIWEEEFKAQGLKPKEASGKATDALCQLFRKTRASLSQYMTVINDGSELLKKLVYAGVISFDTAQIILQNLKSTEGIKKSGESIPHDSIDKVLNAILLQSKTNAASSQGVSVDKIDDLSVNIFKSQVNAYFADIIAKKKAEELASGGNGVGAGENNTNNNDNNNGKKTPPASNDTPLKAITREEFVEDVKTVVARVYNVKPEDIKPENATDVKELNISMLEAIIKTDALFETQTSLDAYPLIRELYIKRMSDVTKLANAIGESEKSEYAAVRKLFSKTAKTSEQLKKELYEKETATPETPATPPAVAASTEVIEMVETDSHEYVVTA